MKNFTNVFNETKTNELLLHRNYLNHFIDFFFDKILSFDSIYNLSKNELIILKILINKNLVNEFIVCFKFSVEIFILFIKKRDENLKLCVNYRNLNAISIKNRYFISLIINILKKLKKIKTFIKLNIKEAYNLIKIK